MGITIEQACDTCRQVSGNDADGQFILAVLAKRTYTIGDDGQCRLDDEQVPLVEDLQFDPDCPELLVDDLDLFALKPATDVIVKGHVYEGRERPRTEASIRIGDQEKRLLVIGDRECLLASSGQVVFSDPAPLSEVPLSYVYAYGGRDEVAESKYPNPFLEEMGTAVGDAEKRDASVFCYPRNPVGRGYLIEATAEAIEQTSLPNLEDPLDPLTPDRLIVENPLRWVHMPLPNATGWVNYGWFPRFGYLGMPPDAATMDRPITEVEREYCPPNILELRKASADDAFRLTSGASLGLQLPHLQGGDLCELINIHPRKTHFSFRLPNERPAIWTDGRQGKFNETVPVIHTVTMEPDESRLTILWRGSAAALRPYLPDELQKMPFRVQWEW